MPFGKDEAARRAAGRKHASRQHTCKCGKVIMGNGYYTHKKTCPTVKLAYYDKDKYNYLDNEAKLTGDAYIPASTNILTSSSKRIDKLS